MEQVLARVAMLIPRLRSAVQLAGFLFAIFAAALIKYVDPNNTSALGIVGVIGLALVVIPLGFRSELIRDLPLKQRAWFLLTLLALLLASLIALAIFTWTAIKLSADGSRFDSRLEKSNVEIFDLDNGKTKLQVVISLLPIGKLGSTAFAGVITVHDESLISDKSVKESTKLSCAEVESCLGAYVMKEKIFIPTNFLTVEYPVMIELKKRPKAVRIWWEFYQSEGPMGTVCRVDTSQIGPTEGIGPVHLTRPDGQVAWPFCYRSTGQLSVPFI